MLNLAIYKLENINFSYVIELAGNVILNLEKVTMRLLSVELTWATGFDLLSSLRVFEGRFLMLACSIIFICFCNDG